MAERPIKIGIDWDGVVVDKLSKLDPRTALKMGIPTMPGATHGIKFLQEQKDVDVIGIYTARPKWLRGYQTRRQRDKKGIPIERIVHHNSYKEKLPRLLKDATGNHNYDSRRLYPAPGLQSVVLIDDRAGEIKTAAMELATQTDGQFAPMLEKFTLIAFNPKGASETNIESIPGVIQIVNMQHWLDIPLTLNKVRAQAA